MSISVIAMMQIPPTLVKLIKSKLVLKVFFMAAWRAVLEVEAAADDEKKKKTNCQTFLPSLHPLPTDYLQQLYLRYIPRFGFETHISYLSKFV